METITLSEITKGQEWVGLGIAGNQAEHLDQAGETEDFKEIVALENTPKGMFPWYIPGANSFLNTKPLSHQQLTNNGEGYLQPEPEIALVVELHYADNSAHLLEGMSVLGFSAFNDCSRRVAEPKISLKKNWGESSQGMAEAIIPIDDFTKAGGTIDSFRLGCYLVRDGQLLQYGKDTAVTDYCYFHRTLVDWIVQQVNSQQDQGPLEPIGEMLASTKPTYGVIGIGATCYSEFGNSDKRFLKENDQIVVIAYDSKQHDRSSIEKLLNNTTQPQSDSSILILQQSVTAAKLTTA